MRHFGLIGFPLGHSLSAELFNEKFRRESIDAEYSLYAVEPPESFSELFDKVEGLNVTIPYKRIIISYLDEISEEAREIGAVNCVRITAEGKRIGYNTDVIGIRKTLSKHNLSGSKALILGTGGAAAAVEWVLRQMGVEVDNVSRNEHKATYTYEQITPELLAEYRLIVNATPVGMYPHIDQAPQLPYEAIDSKHILFDLIYNPQETLMLKLGRERGATTINGMEMFEAQAAAAWEIWNA